MSLICVGFFHFGGRIWLHPGEGPLRKTYSIHRAPESSVEFTLMGKEARQEPPLGAGQGNANSIKGFRSFPCPFPIGGLDRDPAP